MSSVITLPTIATITGEEVVLATTNVVVSVLLTTQANVSPTTKP